jgi:hypothetical protein
MKLCNCIKVWNWACGIENENEWNRCVLKNGRMLRRFWKNVQLYCCEEEISSIFIMIKLNSIIVVVYYVLEYIYHAFDEHSNGIWAIQIHVPHCSSKLCLLIILAHYESWVSLLNQNWMQNKMNSITNSCWNPKIFLFSTKYFFKLTFDIWIFM